MAPILTTPRLVLRRLTPNDLGAVYDVFDDPYARRFYPKMGDRDFVEGWIGRVMGKYESDGHSLWGVVLRDTGALVGDCGVLSQTIMDKPEIEVGYHTAASHRRCGYATEAARACVGWAFTHTDAPRVVSMVHVDNVASAVVAGRIHEHRTDQTFMRHNGLYHLFFTWREEWAP